MSIPVFTPATSKVRASTDRGAAAWAGNTIKAGTAEKISAAFNFKTRLLLVAREIIGMRIAPKGSSCGRFQFETFGARATTSVMPGVRGRQTRHPINEEGPHMAALFIS